MFLELQPYFLIFPLSLFSSPTVSSLPSTFISSAGPSWLLRLFGCLHLLVSPVASITDLQIMWTLTWIHLPKRATLGMLLSSFKIGPWFPTISLLLWTSNSTSHQRPWKLLLSITCLLLNLITTNTVFDVVIILSWMGFFQKMCLISLEASNLTCSISFFCFFSFSWLFCVLISFRRINQPSQNFSSTSLPRISFTRRVKSGGRFVVSDSLRPMDCELSVIDSLSQGCWNGLPIPFSESFLLGSKPSAPTFWPVLDQQAHQKASTHLLLKYSHESGVTKVTLMMSF